MCDVVIMVMTEVMELKAGLLTSVSDTSGTCFLSERGASTGAFFNFQDDLHAQEHI